MFVPRLLVTDDDSSFRHVVCEGLSRRGFRVTEASDGQEAIDLLGRSTVHIALVDVHMPRVGGLDVIRQLNQRPQSPPCVLMSAHLDDEICREAKRNHVYQVLSKPIRLIQLTEVVRRALLDCYGWQSTE